jgi:hypothetical protein
MNYCSASQPPKVLLRARTGQRGWEEVQLPLATTPLPRADWAVAVDFSMKGLKQNRRG